MRRLSIARSVQVALLGLTLALTVIAALGVGALYASRQDYEDRLTDAYGLQGAAARLLAAGVVEEATLRLTPDDRTATRRAAAAYDAALSDAAQRARTDPRSLALVRAAGRNQERLRARPGGVRSPLAARRPLANLADRQSDRIDLARADARSSARRAQLAIGVGAGLALIAALGVVALVLAKVRRPLDDLVAASQRLAGGEAGARVQEQDGPQELQALGASFNAMAADVEAAQARVEAERRRLAVTVRALGDALVITGADGRVVEANPRALELVPGARPGEPWTPPAPLGEALTHEVEREQDGRALAITAAALPDQDGGHVWTVRDVTERARLERAKSDFVATASHELRSPLTSIKGFVELLDRSPGMTDRQRDWVDIVKVSTDRLVELVTDLLDVTRLEAGQAELHRQPTDVQALANEVAGLMRERAEAAGQTLAVSVDPRVGLALVDPGRLRQVLVNLVTNAHVHAGEGVAITVRGRAQGTSLLLDVQDTGRGMDREQVARVFDRFYRGGARDGTTGTGLGMSIVAQLVELHRGRIDVRSEPGEGTTFALAFPHALQATSLLQDGARATLGRDALQGRRVLVVDDEPAITALIAERLAGYGAATQEVHSGAEALSRLRAERFDALTLDVLMPGLSGFEVLRELRADPELRRLPVVVVSVFSGRDALAGEAALAKPIDAEQLADTLGTAVLARRVRVLAVGAPTTRPPVDAVLDELSIERDWADTPDQVALLCGSRWYEAALVDLALPRPDALLEAIDLRGRRARRAVLVHGGPAAEALPAPGDAAVRRIAVADAGAAVLGLLQAEDQAQPEPSGAK